MTPFVLLDELKKFVEAETKDLHLEFTFAGPVGAGQHGTERTRPGSVYYAPEKERGQNKQGSLCHSAIYQE